MTLMLGVGQLQKEGTVRNMQVENELVQRFMYRAIVFVFCRCHHYGLGTNLLCDRPVIILGDAPFLLPKIVLGSNQHVSIEICGARSSDQTSHH